MAALDEEKSPGCKNKKSRQLPLDCGLQVLNTEADALYSLARFYKTNTYARESFNKAVYMLADRSTENGKIVIVGVGKSGHIGKKLVATLQSLGILAVFLHPTEALHGDLGLVKPQDVALFISNSGKTSEILLLLSYIEVSLPTIIISSHERPETCEFISHRPNALLLPAPIPECEYASFGVSAPSTSTTAALALGDALAISTACVIHQHLSTVFARNHPGGIIRGPPKRSQIIDNICIRLKDMPTLTSGVDTSVLETFRTAIRSSSGWVRLKADEGVISPSQMQKISDLDVQKALRAIPGSITPRQLIMCMPSGTTICQALRIMNNGNAGRRHCAEMVLGVMANDLLIGVIDATRLAEL